MSTHHHTTMMNGYFNLKLLSILALATISSAFVQHSPVASIGNSHISSSLKTATIPPPVNTNDNTIEKQSETEKDPKDKFDWHKSWYPLVPVEILDPEKPHKFQFLGMDIVVWNDSPVEGHGLFGPKKNRPKNAKRNGGEWRAFIDECPHRKVPLSEGRVEDDGSLLCSYHAWRFDGDGKVVDVPQLGDGELDSIKLNPKSKCNSFPTKVIDGLLWIWPETTDDARIEAALAEVPMAKNTESVDDDRLWVGNWNFRELPYGADYFIENVVDPAHVEVSHHNVVGSRYNDQYAKIQTVKSLTKDGFAIAVSRGNGGDAGITEFKAPCFVNIQASVTNGSKQWLELYVCPSRPGFSYHVGRSVIQKDNDGKMPPLLRQFTLPMPKWLNHVLAAAFLNQDGLFLHHQERTLSKTGQYDSHSMSNEEDPMNYNKAVLPIDVDKGVINFRNWLRFFAGGRVPYKNNPPMPEADNDIVFDQWNGHTKYCQLCQTALKNLKRARFVSLFVSTCLAVIRPASSKVVNLIGVLATAGLGVLFNKFTKLFYRYEFSHAHND